MKLNSIDEVNNFINTSSMVYFVPSKPLPLENSIFEEEDEDKNIGSLSLGDGAYDIEIYKDDSYYVVFLMQDVFTKNDEDEIEYNNKIYLLGIAKDEVNFASMMAIILSPDSPQRANWPKNELPPEGFENSGDSYDDDDDDDDKDLNDDND